MKTLFSYFFLLIVMAGPVDLYLALPDSAKKEAYQKLSTKNKIKVAWYIFKKKCCCCFPCC